MALVRAVSLWLFPLLTVAFAVVYAVDGAAYAELLNEDSPVENTTAVFMVVAAGLAMAMASRVARRTRRLPWFHALFAAACLFVAVEEVSWGQRIIGFRSPEFFIKHARQKETNLHNVIEKKTKVTTKVFAAVAFLLYGVAAPLALSRSARLRSLAARLGVVVPPLFLVPGFLFAALMQSDLPTQREEEIGEFYFSLCAILFMLAELARPLPPPAPRPHDAAGPCSAAC